jgi:hypothetical protein
MPTVYRRTVLTCVEWGRELEGDAGRAVRIDVPHETPELAFYRVACFEREFEPFDASPD